MFKRTVYCKQTHTHAHTHTCSTRKRTLRNKEEKQTENLYIYICTEQWQTCCVKRCRLTITDTDNTGFFLQKKNDTNGRERRWEGGREGRRRVKRNSLSGGSAWTHSTFTRQLSTVRLCVCVCVWLAHRRYDSYKTAPSPPHTPHTSSGVHSKALTSASPHRSMDDTLRV